MLEADLIDWKYAARTLLYQLHVFLTSFLSFCFIGKVRNVFVCNVIFLILEHGADIVGLEPYLLNYLQAPKSHATIPLKGTTQYCLLGCSSLVINNVSVCTELYNVRLFVRVYCILYIYYIYIYVCNWLSGAVSRVPE